MAQVNFSINGHVTLGAFSTDEDRRYINDDRNRRYFLRPEEEPNFNYRTGFEDYVNMKDDGQIVPLDNVLKWMRDHRSVLLDKAILDSKRSRLNVDFVGRRGLLGRLLQAASAQSYDIHIMVTLYKGTYYVTETGDDWQKTTASNNPNGEIIAASSKLFLQFVRSRDGETPDAREPMNANASYYAVMRADCGEHRLLFSSEIQAENKEDDEDSEPTPLNYVNVRTRPPKPLHPMKALNWWAPNALSGMSQIVCGIRNDRQNIVERVEYIDNNDLPQRYAQDKWSPGACIKGLHSLLSQIKEVVQDDDINSVYHLVLERPRGRDRGQRRFVLKGKRTDDLAVIDEDLVREILQ